MRWRRRWRRNLVDVGSRRFLVFEAGRDWGMSTGRQDSRPAVFSMLAVRVCLGSGRPSSVVRHSNTGASEGLVVFARTWLPELEMQVNALYLCKYPHSVFCFCAPCCLLSSVSTTFARFSSVPVQSEKQHACRSCRGKKRPRCCPLCFYGPPCPTTGWVQPLKLCAAAASPHQTCLFSRLSTV